MKMLPPTLIALATAGVACAGQTTTVTTTPPPIQPLTPAPVVTSDWYAEAAAFGGYSNKTIINNIQGDTNRPKRVNIAGGDVTVGYRLDETNAFQLRLGYGYGADSSRDTSIPNEYNKKEIDTHTFTIMPGYRFTCKLDSTWDFYAAVHAGVGNQSVKFSNQYYGDTWSEPAENDHKSDWGFAYSAEIGLRHHISDNLYTFLAYEFRGSTAAPTVSTAQFGDIKTRAQTYHVVRLGLGCSF